MGSSKPIVDRIQEIAKQIPVAVTVSVPSPSPGAPPITAVTVKPGMSTSEFKTTAVTVGLGIATGIAGALQLIPGPWAIVGAGIMIGLSALGYNQSRGQVKAAAIGSLAVTQPTPMVDVDHP